MHLWMTSAAELYAASPLISLEFEQRDLAGEARPFETKCVRRWEEGGRSSGTILRGGVIAPWFLVCANTVIVSFEFRQVDDTAAALLGSGVLIGGEPVANGPDGFDVFLPPKASNTHPP